MRIKAAAHATFKILCPAPPAGGACCHFHLEVSIYSTSQLSPLTHCPISTHHPCTNINKQDLKWTHWTQPSVKILKGLMIKKLPLSSCNVLRIETTNGQDWWGSQANTSYTKCGLHLIENLNQKSMTLLTSLHLMRHQTKLRPDGKSWINYLHTNYRENLRGPSLLCRDKRISSILKPFGNQKTRLQLA